MYAFLLSAAKLTYCTTMFFLLFLKVLATELWGLAPTKEAWIPHILCKTGNLSEHMHSHCVGVTSQVDAVNANTYNYLPGLFPVPDKRHHRLEEWLSHREDFSSAEAIILWTLLQLSLLMNSQVILLTGSPPLWFFKELISIKPFFVVPYNFNIVTNF